jgi:hypothetical protein
MSRKKPKKRVRVSTHKTPRAEFVSFDQVNIEWCFSIFDRHQWHDDNYNGDSFLDIAKHMKDYQGLTWANIKRKDHPIERNRIITKAQQRLKHLRQEDIDELWRLEFTGCQRLWGIRDTKIFKVLWWDPQHKICPAKKKHT